jgi:hypothetical protein
MLGSRFVAQRVDYLFRRMRSETGPLVLPVNLAAACAVQKVKVLRVGSMATEGALDVRDDGFRIRVRGQYASDLEITPHTNISWLARRQRCTVAHEIGHTLFYDSNVMPPKVLKGSPRAGLLEHFCHLAGRRILIPEFALEAELAQGDSISSQLLLALSDKFVVSPEVALRRVADSPRVKSLPIALFLAEYTPEYDDAVIAAAFFGFPLLTVKEPPPLFTSLRNWVGPWGKGDLWQFGDYTEMLEVKPHLIRMTKTMLPQDLSRFFLHLELSLQ